MAKVIQSENKTIGKAGSLRARLNVLSSETPATGGCVVGKMANGLDDETRQAFFDAMTSGASTSSIVAALREFGLNPSETTMRTTRRRCFSGNGSHLCTCFPELFTGENND